MCRCCQNCWEDFYWNCFEERFCYDESIANYNPDEDEDYLATQKNGSIIGHIIPAATSDNNNLLTVPTSQPICDQPLRRGNSTLISAKIHEEDYRRETQTNVPMLGPEILAVFANSQIFQDHQPTKLNRINTKTHLTGIHTPPNKDIQGQANALPTATPPRHNEQERLLRRLEGNFNLNDDDLTDSAKRTLASKTKDQDLTQTAKATATSSTSTEKRITFTLAPDSSPEGSQILTPKKFESIAEEDNNVGDVNHDTDEIILRPSLIDRHPHLLQQEIGVFSVASGVTTIATVKRTLRTAKSSPHIGGGVRTAASETDIFAITGTGSQISMTPEVPSISFSNLPKNYEDTPTIEKFRVSQSLYSIQTANAARATQDDYSMPRYFRRSAMISQSSEILNGATSLASVSGASSTSSSNDVRRPPKEKSKRLQMLRGNLPPLLIHSVSFKRNRDESKQMD